MPEYLVKSDPDVIAVEIAVTGYIYHVWVNDSFNGPVPPVQLVGLNVRDLLAPAEERKVIAWLHRSSKNKIPVNGMIELNMDVAHKRRKVRFLPQNDNAILGYIVK